MMRQTNGSMWTERLLDSLDVGTGVTLWIPVDETVGSFQRLVEFSCWGTLRLLNNHGRMNKPRGFGFTEARRAEGDISTSVNGLEFGWTE